MEHDFASGTPSKATVGNTSTKILSKKSGRRYACFTNDSDETIYLSYGEDAVINSGIRINANGGVAELDGRKLFRGDVYAICASGGKNISIFEA